MSQKVRIRQDDMNSLALIPSLECYLGISATTVEKPATLVEYNTSNSMLSAISLVDRKEIHYLESNPGDKAQMAIVVCPSSSLTNSEPASRMTNMHDSSILSCEVLASR